MQCISCILPRQPPPCCCVHILSGDQKRGKICAHPVTGFLGKIDGSHVPTTPKQGNSLRELDCDGVAPKSGPFTDQIPDPAENASSLKRIRTARPELCVHAALAFRGTPRRRVRTQLSALHMRPADARHGSSNWRVSIHTAGHAKCSNTRRDARRSIDGGYVSFPRPESAPFRTSCKHDPAAQHKSGVTRWYHTALVPRRAGCYAMIHTTRRSAHQLYKLALRFLYHHYPAPPIAAAHPLPTKVILRPTLLILQSCVILDASRTSTSVGIPLTLRRNWSVCFVPGYPTCR
ncbi:hypothetical protein FA95DRAFT_1560825 [Auriscalpium vulgare]|uniref:Uncharacterized protein n=1 Tax=Auriscalpium vulgare TaxID=40419 RepID=A0ACB8RNN9_9AGAM|nr:hypothetical protein FA95DRAFT_1560825 [Auriscalpium vulgare]